MNPPATAPRLASAGPGCAAELLALQRLCFREEAEFYGEPDIAPMTQTLDSLLDDFRTQTVLGAWIGPRLVGSVRARCNDGTCYIGRLVVHPDHRRQGIGAALMAAIEAAHPAVACYELFTGERTERNRRFYDRLGHQCVGHQVVSSRLTLVLLRKTRPE